MFGGVYLRREICVSKPIGLALQLEVNLPFLLCFTLHSRAIFQVQAPPPGGGLYLEGRFNGGFFCVTGLWGLYLEGLIHGGAYSRNFTVLKGKGLTHFRLICVAPKTPCALLSIEKILFSQSSLSQTLKLFINSLLIKPDFLALHSSIID